MLRALPRGLDTFSCHQYCDTVQSCQHGISLWFSIPGLPQGLLLSRSLPDFHTTNGRSLIISRIPLIRKKMVFLKKNNNNVASKSGFMSGKCKVCMCQIAFENNFHSRASTQRSGALSDLLLVLRIICAAASFPYRGHTQRN